jgi:hypothetical protein
MRRLTLASALLAAVPASAAVQARFSIKPANGAPPVERKLSLNGTKVRVDEGTWSLIADSATGKTLQLQHDKKTWSEVVAKQRGAPSQDSVESRYAAAFGKSVALVADTSGVVMRPTNETKTIAGIQAKRADVYRDGVLERRSWHAESLLQEDLLQFETMLQMTDLGGLIGDELSVGTRGALLGFTVRVEDVVSGDVTEAIEIRRDAPAAAVFSPPAGYRKID